jgi:GR25 family glycosyltransferase involved in LPS biosynthesis
MEASLAKIGLRAVRTSGLSPEEGTRKAGDPAKVEVMRKRTPGAIGCHYAQISVMEEALRQSKHAFVMEDDLVFASDFMERLNYMDAFLADRKWDVLWLGATFHVNPPYWHKGPPLFRDAERIGDRYMTRTYGAFCTYAYIVNARSVQRVLALIDSIVHLSMGIDWAFIQLQPQLQCFAYVPGSIIQYDNQSNIGKGMTIFSGFKKLGPYWFTDKIDQFDPEAFNWHEARRR